MKTIYTLILTVFCSWMIYGNGKKDTINNKKDTLQQIIYDFAKGKYDKYDIKPKRGKPVSLKIKNINPLFYEINIKYEDKTISYQNLDIEQAKKSLDEIQQNNYYKMQESFVFAEENVTLLASGDSKKNNERNEIDKEYLKIDKNLLQINFLENKANSIKNKIQWQDSIKIENYEKKYDSIQNEIKKLKEINISSNYTIKSILQKSNDENLLKDNINKRIDKLNKIYNKYINTTREIIKLNQNYNNYIDKVISPELTYKSYKEIIENQKNNLLLKKCYEGNKNIKCDSLKDKILPIENTFLLNKEKLAYAYGVFKVYPEFYQAIISETNDFISFLNYSVLNSFENSDFMKSVLTKDIERIQKSIKIADDVVQKINLSKKLNQVEILDRIFRDEQTFEYVSAPIQGEEDYVEFDVVIKSKRNLNDTYSVNNDKSFKYFEYLTGGIRFDFSIGTVFDFGTVDKKYTLDSSNKIQRLNNNKYNPTIAGIFHASFRNTSDFALGFSLGTSFNTDFSFNSIFPGISLLMGKRNKFILTAGPSFRLVDELKSNYKEEMQLNNTIADEDLLTKNFKIGAFVGISYNLTPKQKDTLKLK